MELKFVLFVLSAALSIQSDPACGAAMAQVVGRNNLKLCGHDFDNAVSHACGAPRSKRMSLQEESEAPAVPGGWSTESDQMDSHKDLENMNLPSASDKQSQGDHPTEKEPSWTDFYKEYKNIYIPAADDDADWQSTGLEPSASDHELEQPQHDRPPDTEPSWTDFLELYNGEKEYIPTAPEEAAGQKSDNPTGLENSVGLDSRKKRDTLEMMRLKCCTEGCNVHDIFSNFCER